MKRFVARQPIFDRKQKIYGYELLFRAGIEPFFRAENPDLATSSVVVDTFLLFGMKALTGGRRAFVNFTRTLLLNGYARVLPPDQAVIEILESVQPDDSIVAACRDLRERGYVLALDDCVLTEKHGALMDLVNIVKVDFRGPATEQRRELIRRYSGLGIKFLAEKVETRTQFEEARELGYTLFQGYFFGRPEVISSREIPAYKYNYWQLLQAIHRPDPDLKELEEIIKHESALSYKLLRYLNSAAFAFRMEIRSIRHALSLLGLAEVRKWVSVVALAGAAEGRPSELVINSMIRARLAELLAPHVGLAHRAPELFLMGLLSMMDAILERPLADILSEVPVAADIKSALLSRPSQFGTLHEFVLTYEKGDWDQISRRAEEMRLSEPSVTDAYVAAVDWAQQTYQVSLAA